jgi:hypothetical protein
MAVLDLMLKHIQIGDLGIAEKIIWVLQILMKEEPAPLTDLVRSSFSLNFTDLMFSFTL